MTRRILFVDDEPNILKCFKRQLRNQFEADYALGASAALELIRSGVLYAVIVSDMRMPEMDGGQLLAEVRRLSPDTTRLMLTGNPDIQTAIEADMPGLVFRLLSKPCTTIELRMAIEAGLEQNRLVAVEKDLLENVGGLD